MEKGKDARRLLAAASLCGVARHAAADAEECLAGIDPGLPGLLREGQRQVTPPIIVHAAR